ncbi:MAG: DsbA oxidoreductase [uncultured bacterium]|nr:MAG: DsbA oxidoreductase [uncultured bacterium]HLD43825.1 thioredoxin domain-containing protein [bacterium]
MKKIVLLVVILASLLVTKAYAAEIIATVDDRQINESEVMSLASPRMIKVQAQIYDIKRAAVDQLIQDFLMGREAKKRGLSVEQLEKDIRKKAETVSEGEAQVVYNMNKARFQNKSFDEVKTMIMAQLKMQKQQLAVDDFVQELRGKAKVKINLQRPRYTVSPDDDPGQGNKNAPIVLIEFSDFQCPYCKRVRPVLKRLMSQYKDKLYYVFRDFPLSFHKQAKDAANATQCAAEQGKYWEFNEKIWDGQREIFNKELSHEDFLGKFREISKALGLAADKFDSCMTGKKYYAEIDKDQADGLAAGVTGTPAYFINGVFLSGAQPYESFVEVIEDELQLKE